MGKYIVILIAIGVVLLTAAIVSLPVLLIGLSASRYFSTFFILVALQLFLGKLWNYYVDRNTFLEMEKVNAANAMADAVQHLQVTCAYCKTINLVKILIGEDNTYECTACHETNSVAIETSSARTTNPIMPKAKLAAIFNNIDKKVK